MALSTHQKLDAISKSAEDQRRLVVLFDQAKSLRQLGFSMVAAPAIALPFEISSLQARNVDYANFVKVAASYKYPEKAEDIVVPLDGDLLADSVSHALSVQKPKLETQRLEVVDGRFKAPRLDAVNRKIDVAEFNTELRQEIKGRIDSFYYPDYAAVAIMAATALAGAFALAKSKTLIDRLHAEVSSPPSPANKSLEI